jgi:hypothetical protein
VQYSKDKNVRSGDVSGILMRKLNQWFSVIASLKAEHKFITTLIAPGTTQG